MISIAVLSSCPSCQLSHSQSCARLVQLRAVYESRILATELSPLLTPSFSYVTIEYLATEVVLQVSAGS